MHSFHIPVLAVLVALGLQGCGSDDGPKTDAVSDGTPITDGSTSTIPLDELVSACIGASACGVKT